MAEYWYYLVVLLLIGLLILASRCCREDDEWVDAECENEEWEAAPKAPPPLPNGRMTALPGQQSGLRVLDYPKCPVDRSKNEPGKPQVVFWDKSSGCYICCHGHRFTGRE